MEIKALTKHLRTSDQLLEEGLDLNRRDLAQVRRAWEADDAEKAWASLLQHFRKRLRKGAYSLKGRRKPGDKAVERWSRDARDRLSGWRVKGKVDWEHGKRPARKDFEAFWNRGRARWLTEWVAAANARNDADIRRCTVDVFLEWFNACPPPELPVKRWYDRLVDGFAWREIEVGIRGRKLVDVFWHTRDWDDVPLAFHQALLLSIHQSAEYVTSHYACVGPCRGNHQTHHAQVLLSAGLFLPEFKRAAVWRRLGLRILREHVTLDHDPDGVQNENSPSYHLGVMGMYLDAFELLSATGRKPPNWMTAALNRMADFALHSTGPAGRLITLNDAWPNTSASLRRRAAKALNRPDLLALEGKTPAKARPEPGRAFKHAGIAFMRSSWRKDASFVVLDASSHGSGHWHAGKPNLVIHAGDSILACDPQLASYDDPSFWKYFHHARGHNTVLVNGEGAGVPVGFWRFEHIPQPKPAFFKHHPVADIARAVNDGFKRFDTPVVFERTVVFLKPDCVFVHDVLRSKGPHRYDWLLHLVPQKPLINKPKKSLRTALEGPVQLLCRPADGTSMRGPSLKNGLYMNQKLTGGYWSPPAKGKKPALLADAPYGVWTKRSDGTVTFDFVIDILHGKAKPSACEQVSTDTGGTSAFRLERGKREAILVFDDRTSRKRKPVRAGSVLLKGRAGAVVGRGGKMDRIAEGIIIGSQAEGKRRKAP